MQTPRSQIHEKKGRSHSNADSESKSVHAPARDSMQMKVDASSRVAVQRQTIQAMFDPRPVVQFENDFDEEEIAEIESNEGSVAQQKIDASPPSHLVMEGHDGEAVQRMLDSSESSFGGSGDACVQRVDAEHAATLKAAYDGAAADQGPGSLDEKYAARLQAAEYPFEDDSCEREPDEAGPAADEGGDVQMQLKANPSFWKQGVYQLARAAYSISGPKSYGGLNNIVYQTDKLGNIDFSNPSQYYPGKAYPGGFNPVQAGSGVDITASVTAYGKGNRYQHFKEANSKPHLAAAHKGVNGSSPANLTWHHLTSKYDMHLVTRQVHQKHGHNGGVHIW